jgi:hypothetical protein
MKNYTDQELLYAATDHCQCGAGLAYPLDVEESLELGAWVCSKVLRGECTDADKSRHGAFAFSMYKIREETSINNGGGLTTRPAGTIARTVGYAVCGECGHKWNSDPYSACGQSHHWFPGTCQKCGNDCGGHGSWSSSDKRKRIETRYKTEATLVKPAT